MKKNFNKEKKKTVEKKKNEKGDLRKKPEEKKQNPREAHKKEEVLLEGILRKTQKGFGFVQIAEEENEEDVFVHRKNIGDAMDRDIVSIRIVPNIGFGKNREGQVVEVVERTTKEVIGTFQKQKAFGFVVPNNGEDVFVPKESTSGAKDGDSVVAKIIRYPKEGYSAEAKITEIIARKNEPGADIKKLIREKEIRETFPSEAMGEATFVSKAPIEEKGRRDLRKRLIFTIDGEDSKDFDDAVSIEKNDENNFVVGVHIADVAHYVRKGMALDEEAQKRGNSIYLLDRVVPMLPKVLSNGICSLNPKEDRLTLSIDMEIDKKLKVVSYDIYESVICSRHRLNYTEVSDFLEEEDDELLQDSQELGTAVTQMNNLAKKLYQQRSEIGSIDFDLDEPSIKLNEEGIPVEIKIAERRSGHKLIEEFMLLANKTIGEHFCHLDIPFIYRIHEKPEVSKMEELKTFLHGLDINLPGNPNNIHPKIICQVLEQAIDTPYEDIVNNVVLRSMQKAFYSTECQGHFGLAFRYYSHFTSPIRRYSDLMIHRIIKGSLKGEKTENYREAAETAADHCSKTERLAIELEREVEKMKKAEYMSYKIGETHEGVVSGVTEFGIYVELPNTVEGMVRTDSITGDSFDYSQKEKAIVGKKSGKKITLGGKVKIKVKDANVTKRQIDFQLLEY